MADEEQFSLCWNNFNSNLSAGFHESLCRGDLVDVTLAAEGHLVKAHRLVLSVCSPYFRKMFTQMPANQHAFVFLKDVSHAALKDLIQFMYCGEVNVKQDALPTFISTAEALQIKGLTETGEAAATPASAQSPAKVPTPAPSTTSTIAATSPRTRGIQRNISRTSYKIDSEDSSDDKPIVPVPQKRIVQRSLTPVTALPPMKRIKTVDPLEEAEQQQAQQQQQQQQQQHQHHHHTQLISAVESKSSDEPEFIDLPIETIPTKAEPDYGEDGGDVEAVEQDVSYVEDDSYGDMKYDESYFTENDEAKPGASGFTETAYPDGGGEQSTNEAQEKLTKKIGKQNIRLLSVKEMKALQASNKKSGSLEIKPILKLPPSLDVQKIVLKKSDSATAVPKMATEKKASKRCPFCPRLRDRKTTIKCTICNKAACGEHSISYVLCELCQKKYIEENNVNVLKN